ncbi:MAG: hypothetical protein WCA07_13820 [Gloeobacterales cyanobacterium]
MGIKTSDLGPYLVGFGLLLSSFSPQAMAQTIVATPDSIAVLTPTTDRYMSQVTIVSPKEGETINATEVPLKITVQRFPAGKDPKTGLGLHLRILVDNEPPVSYFNLKNPVKLNLSPGTHTVRVIAVRPWDQSYRNLTAFTHVTFNVQKSGNRNAPKFKTGEGLLTLVSPSGTYGAEPILLDYIVDGVNLGKDNYKVRYTLNGQSTTTIDRKELYLTGWKIGQNQLVVELLNASGQVADNAGYNRVERTITFQPNGTDSLSKLIRGEFTPEQMFGALGPEPFVYDNAGNPKLLKPAN